MAVIASMSAFLEPFRDLRIDVSFFSWTWPTRWYRQFSSENVDVPSDAPPYQRVAKYEFQELSDTA